MVSPNMRVTALEAVARRYYPHRYLILEPSSGSGRLAPRIPGYLDTLEAMQKGRFAVDAYGATLWSLSSWWCG